MAFHPMEGSSLLRDSSHSSHPTGDIQFHYPGNDGGILPIEKSSEPVWMHYDPYHGANYTMDLPKGSPVRSASPNPYGSEGESGDEESHPYNQYLVQSNSDRQRNFFQGTRTQDWRLNYHDFLPDLNGSDSDATLGRQTFCTLVEKANSWLKQNPHIDVTSCETVTWTATSPIMIGDSETVVLDRCSCPNSETDSSHVTGMRLWFNCTKQPTLSVQSSSATGPLYDSKAIGYRDYTARSDETLTTFLQRINCELADNWLQGSILSVNSVFIPCVCGGGGMTCPLLWRESQVRGSRHVLLLRIFYIRGSVCRELIGIKDIIPEPNKGNWESFSLLMRTATNWIRKETGVHVTNLQSLYVTRNQQTDSAKESAELSCQSLRDNSAHESFQLLRLYYVARRPEPSNSQRVHHVINCMTFTPVQTTLGPNTEAGFERMRQTMSRISAWLDLAGATIRSAETFITPVSASSANHTLPEMTLWTPLMLTPSGRSNVQKYLMHIRIYLDGDFSDPDPQMLPPLPYSLTLALQGTLQEREYKKYYSQKKHRKRRRQIAFLVLLVIIFIVVIIILLDQFIVKA